MFAGDSLELDVAARWEIWEIEFNFLIDTAALFRE